jgi:large repetitive protein
MKPWRLSLLLMVFASRYVAATIAITTTSLPNGIVKTGYSAVVQASDGCTPYKWAIASGALPVGVTAKVSSTTMSLNLAGTPTTVGTYSFVVKVTGCGGHVSEVSYKVVVQATANHVVDLTWKASTSDDLGGYNVYRGPNGTTWKKINASLIGSTLYSDSTVANGTTYYYATTAVNISGQESSKSATVKVVVP